MRALGIILLIVVLAAAGYGAQTLTLFSWNAVVQYHSPYAAALPSAPGGPALARSVLLIVVDGLRLDASRAMAAVNGLRAQGADFTAWTGEPSLSYPGWTLIATGATQEVSGVTTNWYEGAVAVDHLFAAAKRAGLSTAVAGSPGWAQLFAGSLDHVVSVDDPHDYTTIEPMYATSDRVADGAAALLAANAPALLLVHFPSPDLLGHGFGGASPQYAEAVRRVDAQVAALLQRVDLATTALVVTSDHGHIDSGGHGGWEPVVKQVPLVLAGAGVRAGVQGGDVRQADIAPTVAVLLGIPIPSHSQGRPLVEALKAEGSGAGARWVEQQRGFYRRAADVLSSPQLGAVFEAGRTTGVDDTLNAVASLSDDAAREFFLAREARLQRERARRLPVAAALALLPLLYLALHRRKGLLPAALAGALLFFAVDYGLFYGRGYVFSLSVFNTESLIRAFFNRRLIDAAIAIAAGGLLAGALSARRGAADAARTALDAGLLVAYAILLQVLYFYWLWDVRFAWYLPDLRLGFKYYLDLLMLVPVGFLAVGYVLLALLGRAAVRAVARP